MHSKVRGQFDKYAPASAGSQGHFSLERPHVIIQMGLSSLLTHYSTTCPVSGGTFYCFDYPRQTNSPVAVLKNAKKST
jgi:hypothetical protein